MTSLMARSVKENASFLDNSFERLSELIDRSKVAPTDMRILFQIVTGSQRSDLRGEH